MIFEKRRTAKFETLLPGMNRIKWLTSRKIRYVTAFLLCLIIFGSVVYGLMSGFTVERIEIIGDGMIIEINERLISGNIIFFPSDKVKAEVLQNYPQLSDLIIKKKFPHTITIMPVLRKPFALLVTQKASYGIDKDGNVLGLGVYDLTLPELRIDVPAVVVGMALKDQRVQSALRFLDRSASLVPVSSILVHDDRLSLRAISDKTEILFTQDQNIDGLMASLQTIITGVRIKGTMPKLIDVRFTKPVIQW